MTVDLVIDEGQFAQLIEQKFNEVKVACQSAMAVTVYNTIMANFDDAEGQDRPQPWEQLKPGYAFRVHGGDRTPRLQLSGDLKRSVEANDAGFDAAVVSCNLPYGVLHQEGFTSRWMGRDYEIPARPFFPIDGGEVTPLTVERCKEACKEVLNVMLK